MTSLLLSCGSLSFTWRILPKPKYVSHTAPQDLWHFRLQVTLNPHGFKFNPLMKTILQYLTISLNIEGLFGLVFIWLTPCLVCPTRVIVFRQFSDSPRQSHLVSSFQVLRYLANESENCLSFRGCIKLVGYADADGTGNVDIRQSMFGHCFMLGLGFISWKRKNQNSASTSSRKLNIEPVWILDELL